MNSSFARSENRLETLSTQKVLIMQKFLPAASVTLCLLASAALADPVSLQNCGRTVSIDAVPDRVVSIGQATTEILYSLDLSDRVVGTALWLNEVLPQFKQVNAQIERLSTTNPSFESVASTKPQLVVSQFESRVGPQGNVGTYEQFDELGIHTYVMPTDCIGKNNLTGADGTRTQSFAVDSVYRTIAEMSAIFDVSARGDKLIKDLKNRQEQAVTRTKEFEAENLSALVWFSSPDENLDAYVAGQKGVPGYMLSTLGIRNVIDSDEEWPLVGWETIAKSNPDVIILARMDRRRFPVDDHEVKIDFLRTDPVTSKLEAVTENRIIIVDAHAIQASIRMTSGLETIVDALESFDFAE